MLVLKSIFILTEQCCMCSCKSGLVLLIRLSLSRSCACDSLLFATLRESVNMRAQFSRSHQLKIVNSLYFCMTQAGDRIYFDVQNRTLPKRIQFEYYTRMLMAAKYPPPVLLLTCRRQIFHALPFVGLQESLRS